MEQTVFTIKNPQDLLELSSSSAPAEQAYALAFTQGIQYLNQDNGGLIAFGIDLFPTWLTPETEPFFEKTLSGVKNLTHAIQRQVLQNLAHVAQTKYTVIVRESGEENRSASPLTTERGRAMDNSIGMVRHVRAPRGKIVWTTHDGDRFRFDKVITMQRKEPGPVLDLPDNNNENGSKQKEPKPNGENTRRSNQAVGIILQHLKKPTVESVAFVYNPDNGAALPRCAESKVIESKLDERNLKTHLTTGLLKRLKYATDKLGIHHEEEPHKPNNPHGEIVCRFFKPSGHGIG